MAHAPRGPGHIGPVKRGGSSPRPGNAGNLGVAAAAASSDAATSAAAAAAAAAALRFPGRGGTSESSSTAAAVEAFVVAAAAVAVAAAAAAAGCVTAASGKGGVTEREECGDRDGRFRRRAARRGPPSLGCPCLYPNPYLSLCPSRPSSPGGLGCDAQGQGGPDATLLGWLVRVGFSVEPAPAYFGGGDVTYSGGDVTYSGGDVT